MSREFLSHLAALDPASRKAVEDDLAMFGNAFTRRNEDGTVERIDPSTVRIKDAGPDWIAFDEWGRFTREHAYLIDQWKKESDMPNENEPAISTEEAAKVVAAKTLPKITKESIEEAIGGVSYLHHDELTICIITMKTGFMVFDGSAPASKGNFDEKAGERIAYDKAFRQLWALEGYLLKAKLHQAEAAPDKPE